MLGDRIRKIRKNDGLTISALAERIGVSESYISQLERGLVDPSVSLLRKLAHGLGVPVAAFFDDDGSPPIITRMKDRDVTTSGQGTISFSWISPDADNLRLEMAEFSIIPQASIQAPANKHHVCLFLLEGALKVQFGDTDAALQEGDSIFIPANAEFQLSTGEISAKGILCVTKGGEV